MGKRQANVLLKPDHDVHEAAARLLGIRGVVAVHAVFPNDDDDELRRMFVVEVDDASADGAVAALAHAEDVDDVELAPKRRPRRSA